MIDLIIPYYKNIAGLTATLLSINYDVFQVTIVDDGSDSAMDLAYEFGCNIILLGENHGPGYARQIGIDYTTNDYIMFIDTNDIFVSKEIQEEILYIIKEKPQSNVFSWLYYYKNELTKHTDNRMHGKVYRRDFLKKYNITFCAESSYMDEDIGFNRTCRLIIEQNNLLSTRIDKPVIKWIENKDSLTQKDNCAVLYRDQTRALSLVSIHTIETCRKNNIDTSSEINQIAISLYYWFLQTVIKRPEFIKQAWEGAKIFYKKYENDINPNTIILGNPEIKKCLELKSKVKFPINILRFAKEMMQDEIIPNYYLT